MDLKLLPPSINHSNYQFTVVDENTIIHGLGAIKGAGETAIQCIVHERDSHGPYEGLFSFCQRLDMRKVNRRVLEALIKSGAFDDWGKDRAVIYESLEKALHIGAQFNQNKVSGQTDLFSLFEESLVTEDYIECSPWDTKTRLDGEKETLGFYMTGHPADAYTTELKAVVRSIGQLNPAQSKKAMICGQVTSLRKILTKRGKKLVILNLEDASGGIDIVVFSEVFEPQQACVLVGHMLVVEGELGQDDYTGGLKMTAIALYGLNEARTRFAKCLAITLSSDDHQRLPTLQSILKAHQGECVVQIRYLNAKARAAINLAPQWRVTPSDELMKILADILEKQRVELCYT